MAGETDFGQKTIHFGNSTLFMDIRVPNGVRRTEIHPSDYKPGDRFPYNGIEYLVLRKLSLQPETQNHNGYHRPASILLLQSPGAEAFDLHNGKTGLDNHLVTSGVICPDIGPIIWKPFPMGLYIKPWFFEAVSGAQSLNLTPEVLFDRTLDQIKQIANSS